MNIERALTIDGWMSEEELIFLAQQAEIARLIVEFGCYKGRSTRALADNTSGIVIAVDPWDGVYYANNNSVHGIKTDVFDEFKANLLDQIHIDRVVPYRMYSQDFYTAASPGFVFIDGDHRYETVKHDIELAFKIMRNGGILAGHDYTHTDWPGVKQAVDEIFPKVNVIDSIWWIHVESKSDDGNSDNGIRKTG